MRFEAGVRMRFLDTGMSDRVRVRTTISARVSGERALCEPADSGRSSLSLP